jgi:hypothetical protein
MESSGPPPIRPRTFPHPSEILGAHPSSPRIPASSHSRDDDDVLYTLKTQQETPKPTTSTKHEPLLVAPLRQVVAFTGTGGRLRRNAHTKAMHLMQAGVSPVTIKDLLGHAHLKTLELYVEADLEMKRRAQRPASTFRPRLFLTTPTRRVEPTLVAALCSPCGGGWAVDGRAWAARISRESSGP